MSSRDALLMVGHGSTRYPDAGALLQRHADTLRHASHFCEVEIALLNGRPAVNETLARIATSVVRVVPFFMEDGYFSRVAVPRAFAADTGRIRLCPPVGVHNAMARIIEHQALSACTELGVSPDHVAVVVVGHGSAKAPGRALALHRHVFSVAATGRFARVEAACLEEAPLVDHTLQALSQHPVIVIGFFANRGGHVLDDVPALIADERLRRGGGAPPVRFHASVTEDPAILRIILDQSERPKI